MNLDLGCVPEWKMDGLAEELYKFVTSGIPKFEDCYSRKQEYFKWGVFWSLSIKENLDPCPEHWDWRHGYSETDIHRLAKWFHRRVEQMHNHGEKPTPFGQVSGYFFRMAQWHMARIGVEIEITGG